jgi:hypothetical protein
LHPVDSAGRTWSSDRPCTTWRRGFLLSVGKGPESCVE